MSWGRVLCCGRLRLAQQPSAQSAQRFTGFSPLTLLPCFAPLAGSQQLLSRLLYFLSESLCVLLPSSNPPSAEPLRQWFQTNGNHKLELLSSLSRAHLGFSVALRSHQTGGYWRVCFCTSLCAQAQASFGRFAKHAIVFCKPNLEFEAVNWCGWEGGM